MLGDCLEQAGRLAEALTTIREALEVITPIFTALPHAYAGLTTAMMQRYLQYSEALGQQPDTALLAPSIETFACRGDTPEEGTG